MRIDTLRITDLGLALRCPLQLWHKLTLGAKPPKASMLIGTCFHKSLARNFYQKPATRKDLTLDEVISVYETQFALNKDKTKFDEMKPAQAEGLGKHLLVAYYKNRCPVIMPASQPPQVPVVEYPIYLKVSNATQTLTLTGTIDLLTDKAVLLDYKTATRKWAENRGDKEIQPFLYIFGMRKQGFQVRNFQFDVVRPLKEDVQIDSIEVDYIDQIAQSYLRMALRVKDMLEREQPIPNTQGWWCSESWCGFWEDCEFGGKQKIYSF